jgi:hypothetical protein
VNDLVDKYLGKKNFMISKFFTSACNERNQRIVNEELKKCVILCSNCHREVEAGIREL